MPAITIQSLELTNAQKEILAEKYITAFSEVTNVPKDRIYLFFDGYTLDNLASNCQLFSKHPPKNLKAKFNENSTQE